MLRNGNHMLKERIFSEGNDLLTQLPELSVPSRQGLPPAFHLLAKPTGAPCNLACSTCFFLDPVLFARNGECPKNRFSKAPNGDEGLNYLCAGYKAFFQRVNEPMKIKVMLLNSGRSATNVMPIMAENEEVQSRAYRNTRPVQPCPCVSGLAYQIYQGWNYSKRFRRGRSAITAQLRPPERKIFKQNHE